MEHQLALGIRLPDTARYDNFHAGPNAEVLRALQTLGDSGDAALLYLSGGAGSGKSHLLQAFSREMTERGRQAVYLPLGELAALGPAILEGLESADAVVLDDLDGVAGDTMWEEALFHLFNRLRDAGRVLLVAAADRPDAIGLRLPDLVSRLTWGLVYALSPLDDAGRLSVLQLRAEQRGLELNTEVGQFLLRRCERDLTALCQLVDRLDEASLAAQRRLTIPFVKTVIDA